MLMKDKPQPYFDLCFGKRAAEELYVVKEDPDQVRNVAARPEFANVKKELAERVEQWMKNAGDPRATNPHTDCWDREPCDGNDLNWVPVRAVNNHVGTH